MRCPNCKISFPVPEGEEGEHPCYKCNRYWWEYITEDDEE